MRCSSTIPFVLFAACGGQEARIVVTEEATIGTGGAAQTIAFLPSLPGAPPDVAVGNARRGQIDVLIADPDAGYRLFGSFLAGGAPERSVVARVSGTYSLIVLIDDDRLVLLAQDVGAAAAHRLLFPVPVHRERVQALAAADLNGDGDDDLVAAAGNRLLAFEDLATSVGADAEHAPGHRPRMIDPSFEAGALALADLDGDGLADVVAASASEPIARLYRSGAPEAGFDGIALPAVARSLHTTGCEATPVFAVLADGAPALVGSDRTASVMLGLGPVREVATGGAGVAIAPAPGDLALFDACLEDQEDLGLLDTAIGSLALSTDRLASIAPDGASVTVYRLGE